MSRIPFLDFDTAGSEANLPIACSLEPCADVRTTVLSQLNRDTGRKNKTTARVTTCSKKARVCTSHPLLSQQMWRSWGDSGGGSSDLCTTRRSRREVEKACLLGSGFLPDQQHCIACSKTLDCPTTVENKERETKGENLPALLATCKNLRNRREKTKTSRCAGPTKGRAWSPSPRNGCNGKQTQHKDVKGSVNSCSLSLCRRNVKLPHTHTLA